MFTELLEECLKETYVEVPPEKIILNGSEGINPIAMLKDEYGGEAPIIEDDHCYVVLLKQSKGGYKPTAWIFPEAFEVFKKLPSLEPA